MVSAKGGADWLAFLSSLTARGLSGVRLVISDTNRGLAETIGAALPGAVWQRCHAHYARNLANQVPKSAQSGVATLLRTVFGQPDAHAVHAWADQVIAALKAKFPKAAHLDEARVDLPAFTAFPHEILRQI